MCVFWVSSYCPKNSTARLISSSLGLLHKNWLVFPRNMIFENGKESANFPRPDISRVPFPEHFFQVTVCTKSMLKFFCHSAHSATVAWSLNWLFLSTSLFSASRSSVGGLRVTLPFEDAARPWGAEGPRGLRHEYGRA